jgi:hypothetical protein
MKLLTCSMIFHYIPKKINPFDIIIECLTIIAFKRVLINSEIISLYRIVNTCCMYSHADALVLYIIFDIQ